MESHAAARLCAEDFIPRLEIDAELSLSGINPDLLAELRMLEPFGMGNREPVFAARDVRLHPLGGLPFRSDVDRVSGTEARLEIDRKGLDLVRQVAG